MPTYYAVQIRKEGVGLRLAFNEVPLAVAPRRDPLEVTEPINAWTLPGANAFSVRLEWPSETLFSPGQARTVVTVLSAPQGKDFSSLARLEWPTPEIHETGDRAELYPRELRLEVRVDDPPPSEFWRVARPIALTPRILAEILRVLRHTNEALSARDWGLVLPLLRYRAMEMARTHFYPLEKAEASQRGFLEFATKGDGFAMEPIGDDVTMELIAGGRIVWVTREGFRPLFRTVTGAGLALPAYVGNVDGAWTLVR